MSSKDATFNEDPNGLFQVIPRETEEELKKRLVREASERENLARGLREVCCPNCGACFDLPNEN